MAPGQPLGLILADVEHDDLIRSASAANVKLDRLTNGLVFLLDVFVVGYNVNGVFVVLGIGLTEQHLDGADVLRLLFLLQRKFEDVALTETPRFASNFVISCATNEPALDTEVADSALQLALGSFKIGLGGRDIGFGSVEIGGHLAEFGGGVGFDGTDLLANLLIGFLLILLDGLGHAAGASEFILREPELLGGDFQFCLQVGNASVGLTKFLIDSLGLFIGSIESRASGLMVVIILIEKVGDQSKSNKEEQQGPA